MLAPLISGIVRLAVRRAAFVLLAALALAAASTVFAVRHIDVTTDVDLLFARTLPWKQRDRAMRALFPQFADLLVCVVEADSPEAADATAAGLATSLASRPDIRTVRRPDASPFLDRNGLMFLDTPALEKLLDQTIDAQPFIGQLAADPSARGLFVALALLGMGVERGEADLGPYLATLRAFDASLQSALEGHPRPLSWQRLLAGSLSDLGGPYRFVLVQPRLDHGALQPGGAATLTIRAAIAEQPFVRDGQARVRITGAVALADEEFATVAQGAVAGLIGSTLVVALWLFLAVRTWRLVVPILLTLFVGLAWTAGFAVLTSNPLNLISIAFAILFVGIAVDFAIQFSVRYREMTAAVPETGAALEAAGRAAGGQILIAAAATASGFLAFVPTDFTGVAELGLIAGVGMLIAFAATVTVLPACLRLLAGPPGPMRGEAGFPAAAALDRAVIRARRPLLALFGALAVAGVIAVPRLQFDSDPLHTKDPTTEAMQTLANLTANPVTNPYTIDILARDRAAAQALVNQLQRLPLVDQVLWLGSFVPQDQAAKLPLITDAAGLLASTLAPRGPAAPVSARDLRLAAATASTQLDRAVPLLPADHLLVSIAAGIRALRTASDDVVLAANASLTRFLPDQLQRLRTALMAGPVELADIPPEIARDWLSPDGRYRVQVSGKLGGGGNTALRAFAREVSAAVPEAGGAAVTIVETAQTIVAAFTHAALGALAAILAILALALRRPVPVLMVLAPLLMSGLTTALAAVLLGFQLNFANIIALPLLLGVGVSFNIYFVMNWLAGQTGPLASPTCRAVVFSALTTGTAFGSLALSRHPGTASMGDLLLLSLMCTLLASLVFVPALLATFPPYDRTKVSNMRR